MRGGRISVGVELVDPASGANLWTENYERDFAEVFEVQSDIAMSVANALNAEFSSAEQARIERAPTNSPQAYVLYLRAEQSRDPSEARSLLLQAIEFDPEFALAYGWLAMTDAFALVNSDLGGQSAPPEQVNDAIRRSRAYADRAIAIDPSTPYAHSALAIPAFLSWRWSEAEQAFARALEVAPNDDVSRGWYGYLLNYTGRSDEAMALAERARQLSPDAPNAGFYAFQLGYAGQYARAADALKNVLSQFPLAITPRNWLAMMAIAQGDTGTALRELDTVERIAGTNRPFVSLPEWAYGYGRVEQPDDAERIFKEIVNLAEAGAEPGAGGWARAYLAIGNHQAALERLEEAASKAANHEPDEGFFNLMNLKMNVANDPVLRQPEFVDVLNRIRGD